MPSVEEEDAKRPHRGAGIPGAGARAHRKSHRRVARHPGRSGERPSLRSWDADMRALRTGDGRPLPTHLVAELNRLRRAAVADLEMIRELDAVREAGSGSATHDSRKPNGQALCTIRGIGVNFASRPQRGGVLPDVRQQAANRQLSGSCPNALSERRHGSRSTHQSRRQQPSPQNASSNSPGFGFATSRKAAGGVVPGPCWLAFGVESAASQSSPWRAAVDRNLALRHAGPRTGGAIIAA